MSWFWCKHSLIVTELLIHQSCWKKKKLYGKVVRKDEMRTMAGGKKRRFMNWIERVHSSASLFFPLLSVSVWLAGLTTLIQHWLRYWSRPHSSGLQHIGHFSPSCLPHLRQRQAGNRPSHYTPGFAKPFMSDRQFKQPCHCSSPFDLKVFKVSGHIV